jgi:ATP-binding protein involved in chromosome partitioning
MVTEDNVRSALERVVYPSFGLSVMTLGMVRDVRVKRDTIEVDMVMNCPGCPAGEATLTEVQRTLRSLLSPDDGVIKIQLLSQAWTPPWEASF